MEAGPGESQCSDTKVKVRAGSRECRIRKEGKKNRPLKEIVDTLRSVQPVGGEL